MEEIKVYTVKDLEQILGVGRITILKYLNDGKIKGVKVGREWRVSQKNLEQFLNGDEENEKH